MSTAPVTPESWPWPPAIRASAAWHAAAVGAGVLVPGAWPWALGAIVLNHALITAAGLTPRSRLLGPNVTRLPAAAIARREVAITIDDGPEPAVTPRVLDLLDAHGQRATFFCIAERVRASRRWRARSSRAATASRTTRRGTGTTSLFSARAASPARSRRRSRSWPRSRASARAAFARRPGCAIPFWNRCCTGSACRS